MQRVQKKTLKQATSLTKRSMLLKRMNHSTSYETYIQD